jgi:hypothetical protein
MFSRAIRQLRKKCHTTHLCIRCVKNNGTRRAGNTSPKWRRSAITFCTGGEEIPALIGPPARLTRGAIREKIARKFAATLQRVSG